jgi:hypothetical protein
MNTSMSKAGDDIEAGSVDHLTTDEERIVEILKQGSEFYSDESIRAEDTIPSPIQVKSRSGSIEGAAHAKDRTSSVDSRSRGFSHGSRQGSVADINYDVENHTTPGRNRAFTFSATAPGNAPTILSFQDLTVSTGGPDKSAKVLLNKVSGSITGENS